MILSGVRPVPNPIEGLLPLLRQEIWGIPPHGASILLFQRIASAVQQIDGGPNAAPKLVRRAGSTKLNLPPSDFALRHTAGAEHLGQFVRNRISCKIEFGYLRLAGLNSYIIFRFIDGWETVIVERVRFIHQGFKMARHGIKRSDVLACLTGGKIFRGPVPRTPLCQIKSGFLCSCLGKNTLPVRLGRRKAGRRCHAAL